MQDPVDHIVARARELAEASGEITFEQLNALVPAEVFTSELIEAVLRQLSNLDIEVVEIAKTPR